MNHLLCMYMYTYIHKFTGILGHRIGSVRVHSKRRAVMVKRNVALGNGGSTTVPLERCVCVCVVCVCVVCVCVCVYVCAQFHTREIINFIHTDTHTHTRRHDAGCSVLQCGAVWCSVVQCGAVWYSVLQDGAV